MTDLNVTAELEVDDGTGASRQFSVADLQVAQTGASTEATLAAFKTANHTDITALATALAAVLAKLSADPATQTTTAAILAKLSADPATQTTLAAVLAKLSADPATQTTLAAAVAALGATSDASSALTHTGLLKAIKAALTGTLLVESSSLSKGYAQATSTAANALLSSLVTIPAGATKVLLTPSAQVRITDDGSAPSASAGYPIPASTEWAYDGDKLSALRVYGAATVDCWFYA